MNRSESIASFEQIDGSSTAGSDSPTHGEFDLVEEIASVQPVKPAVVKKETKKDVRKEMKKETKKDKKLMKMEKKVEKRSENKDTSEKTLGELFAGLEERLFSVIIRSHDEINARIGQLEERMDRKMEAMREVASADTNMATEDEVLQSLKQKASEAQLALLSEIKDQLANIDQQRQEIAKEAKAEPKKSSAKRRVDSARKGMSECFGKIKTRLPFKKPSASASSDSIAFKSGDGDEVTTLGKEVASRSVVINKRRKCTVNFRAEGAGDSRRWFVKSVAEPEPCALQVGDEILKIGESAVAGLSLDQIKELIAAIPEAGTVQVRA